MRLAKARIQKYRSIRDTGWFDIENNKTILVGPNEAGKTVLLQALQQINPPDGIIGFDALRDYPRSEFNDITTGRVDPANVTVVEAQFILDPDDQNAIPDEFKGCIYVVGRKLNNTRWHSLNGGPSIETYGNIVKDLSRLCTHIDSRYLSGEDEASETEKPSAMLREITQGWSGTALIFGERATALQAWLDQILSYVDEENSTEDKRYDRLVNVVQAVEKRDEALKALTSRVPVFVLFNNYFRVRPLIHLEHLAQRIESGVLDDDQYDYGNECLLKLLGFTVRELSELGRAPEPSPGDSHALKSYRDQLDMRTFQLNSASVKLTEEIRSVWRPDPKRLEADRLRVQADGQYLKVVIEDDLGVEIELNQRSEGFQWLVSFFVVFFAEALDRYDNAILLLDEPGLSLHGFKQRDFRSTISRLAESNQTLYTTHSPFLVGPDELDLVRVVEMTDRKVGTSVHTTLTSSDPAALLPLQEALGYDLAQSLFAQQRNLVLEGLTDYWYLDATAQILRDACVSDLNENIALVFANSAGKVVYYATILHAQKLKVTALLDSDSAGDQAAQQDALVHTLGNRRILRTKDAYSGDVTKPEIEDLLRDTLVDVAKVEFGCDVSTTATTQMSRPIVDIFTDEIQDFSKYKLAKAYIRWTRDHEATDLLADEQSQWKTLISRINGILK